MGPLSLAGVVEAAEILAKPSSRVKRWEASGKMPPPVAVLAATPIWLREDVIALRDGATEFPERERWALVGLAEAADLLRVDKSQIGRWRRAGVFPEPAYEKAKSLDDPGVRATPLWMRDAVVAFGARRAA